MTGYERHNSHIAYFLGGNIMWIKKNNLLVNLEKFDALYQDTLHPENLVIMTDRKKRTLAKIDDVSQNGRSSRSYRIDARRQDRFCGSESTRRETQTASTFPA